MSEVRWIKLSVNMFADEKIELIEVMPEGDTILIIWIKLLALAGRCNERGRIVLAEGIPYTDEMLSTLFGRPLNTIRLALQALERFGMIEFQHEQVLWIRNWEKHQNVEGLDKIREQGKIRQQRFKARQKAIDAPSRHRHGDKVMLTDKEYEKLCERYTKAVTDQYIEKINDYCVQHGQTYTDYNRTVHTWIKNDKVKGKLRMPAVSKSDECPECKIQVLGGVCHKCGWRK